MAELADMIATASRMSAIPPPQERVAKITPQNHQLTTENQRRCLGSGGIKW